jgi:hypothetical protein
MTLSPANRLLVRRIELTIAVYTAVAALAAGFFHSLRFGLGIACGGAITYLNFLVVAGLIGKVLQAQKTRYWLFYAAKSLALFGIIVALIYFRLVDGLPLLIGLLSLFVAVAAAAMFYLWEDRRQRSSL